MSEQKQDRSTPDVGLSASAPKCDCMTEAPRQRGDVEHAQDCAINAAALLKAIVGKRRGPLGRNGWSENGLGDDA